MEGSARVPRRAMILAAGLGERMRPLTLRRAKPALPILNRPLIVEIARRLAAAGVGSVVVNLHHRPETVRAALADGAALGLSIVYSEEQPQILGTGGGVRRARPHLEAEPFLLLNGDSLPGCDLRALARAHRRCASLATLVVRPLRGGEKYRPVEADGDGRVWRIAGRPASPLVPPHGLASYVFTGVHLIEPGLFEFFPDQEVFDINRDVYPAALAAGRRISAWVDASPWYEIGDPGHYLAASLEILDGGGLEKAEERRVRKGIYAAHRVSGLKRARLEPPVWVGAGARLGEGASLRRCVIGPGCEVDESAVVEESVLMAGARVGSRARLRRVVAEDGVEVPPAVELDSQVLVREDGALTAFDLPGSP